MDHDRLFLNTIRRTHYAVYAMACAWAMADIVPNPTFRIVRFDVPRDCPDDKLAQIANTAALLMGQSPLGSC